MVWKSEEDIVGVRKSKLKRGRVGTSKEEGLRVRIREEERV